MYFTLLKNLIDNLSTFLLLFSEIGLINKIEFNSTNLQKVNNVREKLPVLADRIIY